MVEKEERLFFILEVFDGLKIKGYCDVFIYNIFLGVFYKSG